MNPENIPTMAASHEEFAAWYISIETIKEQVKKRLGKEHVNIYAEVDEDDGKVFLKECEKCDLPTITHQLPDIGCTIINNGAEALLIQTGELLKELIKNEEGKENFSAAIMEEIEKLPEFEQVKTLLEELKIRTCVCTKVCVNERGLKTHKRKCDAAKNAITREPSTTSSTNENTMMIQLMNQMREDRIAQQEKDERAQQAQQEQNERVQQA